MSKSSGTQTIVPTLSPEQNAMIAAQTGLFTGTVGPSYETAVKGASDMYNASLPGVEKAAGNVVDVSNQLQNVLGTTGQAALQTGIGGLTNLFSPEYEKQQMEAATLPAQAQYIQNITGQKAQFGGAGQLGSARHRLAEAQTAGTAQASQMSALAEVQRNIAAQRAAAAGALISAGQTGLGGAGEAAKTSLTAAFSPQQLYNQYASVLFGTPAGSYTPNFAGTQTQNVSSSQRGINLADLIPKFGS